MSQPPRKLLLVDDDQAFLQVMGRALTRRGFAVLPAATAEEALEAARSSLPEFALVDLKLEQSSGLDLIPELIRVNAEMTIVVLTGYASVTTAVTAIKRGAANYLAKPVKVDEVISALGEKDPAALPDPDYSPMSVERLEWEHIQKVLQENDGNISATARSLGMYRRTLQRKLAKKPKAL
ncbi:MAG: response regulator transcription factor [Xanthomonadales bacterium]|jgi:two-component system response regulator RegA|nr:response regulator transcription factor [Xanthomonadales bacterium]